MATFALKAALKLRLFFVHRFVNLGVFSTLIYWPTFGAYYKVSSIFIRIFTQLWTSQKSV
jgi:hypothetical protein